MKPITEMEKHYDMTARECSECSSWLGTYGVNHTVEYAPTKNEEGVHMLRLLVDGVELSCRRSVVAFIAGIQYVRSQISAKAGKS